MKRVPVVRRQLVLFRFLVVIFIFCSDIFESKATSSSSTKGNSLIRIRMEGQEKGDTFYFSLYKHLFDRSWPDETLISTCNSQGVAELNLKTSARPVYFSLYKETSGENNHPAYLLELYLLEPGDSIDIYFEKRPSPKPVPRVMNWYYFSPMIALLPYEVRFSGPGANKYQCRFEIDTQCFNDLSSTWIIDSSGNFIKNSYFDKCIKISDQGLRKYRKSLSKSVYETLRVDFFSTFQIGKLFVLEMLHGRMLKNKAFSKKIADDYWKSVDEIERKLFINGKILSGKYSQFVSKKYLLLRYNWPATQRELFINTVFIKIDKQYTREIRDKILTQFLIDPYVFETGGQVDLYEKAYNIIKTEYCLDKLHAFSSFVLAGKPAYNFRLPDITGKTISLEDFRGKIIFIDFWYDGCYGCAVYYKKVISQIKEKYKNNPNVIFVSISSDVIREKWIEAIKGNKYTSFDAVNLYTEGEGVLHPVIKNYGVWTFPKALIIDTKGNVLNNNFEELHGAESNSRIEKIIDAELERIKVFWP